MVQVLILYFSAEKLMKFNQSITLPGNPACVNRARHVLQVGMIH